jgi:peptidoglycan/LPS O-acetylase OafA/YrhL
MRSLTHAEYLAMRRFPALDGMRAIAAVMVVFFHFAGPRWAWLNGFLGVHMFFVLSGFLITTLALREESRTGRVSLREFYVRRVFRILPVYYVVLAMIVALAWLRGEWVSSGLPGVLDNYLTFTNEWAPNNSLFGQSWTLGVEQKFYLAWPLLVFTVGAFTFARHALTTVGLLVLAVVGVSVLPPQASAAAYFMILVGCLLAFVLHNPRGFAVMRPLTHPVVAIPVAVALIALQSYMIEATAFIGYDMPAPALYAVLVALLVVSTLGRGPVRWILSRPSMVFVGERSYSLYLVQGLAGVVVVSTFPVLQVHRTATGVVVTIVGLFIADLLHRWVELPMIDRGRQLIGTLRLRSRREVVPSERTREPASVDALV